MHNSDPHTHSHSFSCSCCTAKSLCGVNRRQFIAGAGLTVAAGALLTSSLASAADGQMGKTDYSPCSPLPLRVQPLLLAQTSQRREQASWRSWGAIQTAADIEDEKGRIQKELEELKNKAEFSLEILPLIHSNSAEEAASIAKGSHDVLLMYPANSWTNVLEAATNPDKNTLIFIRHRSGPVYLWYEVIHNRYLRKTVDAFGQPSVDCDDVVVDDYDKILFRLRALYALRNTCGKKIVCIGGPGGWGVGGRQAPQLTQKVFKMQFETVDYPTLARKLQSAYTDRELVKKCQSAADVFLGRSGIRLETDKQFVFRAFVLTEVFKAIMQAAGTDAITINSCMGTIMQVAETTACLPLMLLNDAGYSAYCESDFVAIPSGILLHYISSKPVFFNDPTYPHDGIVTLAHCTAPSRMDGTTPAPARILTHFESDYGAAPKVEMEIGRKITVIDPDFDFQKTLGFEGEIVGNPFMDICRSQIDVGINGSVEMLNQQTRGFHWNACYGNYLHEYGYAVRKLGMDWQNLSV